MSSNYKETFENATALLELMLEKVSKTVQDVSKDAYDAIDAEVQLKKLTYERKRKIYELGEETLATKIIPQNLVEEIVKLDEEIKAKKEEISNKQSTNLNKE